MKKILLVLALAGMLACNAALGEPTAAPTPRSTLTPSETPSKTPSTSATAPASTHTSTAAPTQGPRGFVEARLDYQGEILPELLAAESQKAIALGLMPVVEFDAVW